MALINLINWKYYCECWAVHTHYVCYCEFCKFENELDVKGNLIK